MKRYISKFLIIFFFFGINVPFSFFILDNLKKKSLTYSVLCKFNDESESKTKTTAKNCFFCILKKEKSDDDVISAPCTNVANLFLDSKDPFFYKNFSYLLKNNFQKTRGPPFKS